MKSPYFPKPATVKNIRMPPCGTLFTPVRRAVSLKILETGQPVGFTASDAGLWLALPTGLQRLQLPVIAIDEDPV